MERLIQGKESNYDLHHQHRFETYYMKNSISYRGSIVWNLLEPSAVSARDYEKRVIKSPALRNLNFSEESPQMGSQIDSDFVFLLILFISLTVNIPLFVHGILLEKLPGP